MAKRPKSDGVERVEAEDIRALLNPTVIEAMMSQLASSRLSEADDLAQEVMFDAWEEPNPKKRIALARKALRISPDCTDAWILLAEETAETAEACLELYAKAVAAGERALGKAAFKEDVGMFWGLIETRPYMRACHGLAMTQWAVGRHDEAIARLQDMLRLNPNDNQGVRYVLLDWLVRLGRDADLAPLVKRYKNDGGAEWLWPLALIAFRKSGPSAAARRALQRAMDANAFAADYLTGRKKAPRSLPEFIVVGSKEEGASIAEDTAPTWASYPDALAWLAAETGAPAAKAAPSKRSARQPI